MNKAITVPFHGNNLFVIDFNGQPYTPMKPIIDGMGMDWASQFTKLKQRFKTSVVKITMRLPDDSQRRDVICLALRKLNGWLQTVSPNKVRPEIRDRVIQYQEECDDVLYEYWTTGEVKRRGGSEPTFIVAPTDQNGDWVLHVKEGRVCQARRIEDGEFILSIESFKEISERAGNIVIPYERLRKMTSEQIYRLISEAEKQYEYWREVMGRNKIA